MAYSEENRYPFRIILDLFITSISNFKSCKYTRLAHITWAACDYPASITSSGSEFPRIAVVKITFSVCT